MIIQITQYNSTIYGARGHLTNVLPVNTSPSYAWRQAVVVGSHQHHGFRIAIAIIFGCLFLNLGAHDQKVLDKSSQLMEAGARIWIQSFGNGRIATSDRWSLNQLLLYLRIIRSVSCIKYCAVSLAEIVLFFVISFTEPTSRFTFRSAIFSTTIMVSLKSNQMSVSLSITDEQSNRISLQHS